MSSDEPIIKGPIIEDEDREGNFYIGEKGKNGLGIQKKPDRELYHGMWSNGLYDGFGYLVKAGNVYTGEFSKGNMSGFGQLVEQNTKIYVGEISKSKKQQIEEFSISGLKIAL